MKKTLFVISLLFFSTLFVTSSHAQMMGQSAEYSIQDDQVEEHVALDELMPEILDKYSVSSINKLKCDEVSDNDFERVGEAVMETMHPEDEHEAMDEMMGGEGSDSLEQAHINMGKNYLRCQDESIRGFGMMGRNFNNMPMARRYTQSNNLNTDPLSVIWVVNSLLITVLLVLLNIFFWKKIRK